MTTDNAKRNVVAEKMNGTLKASKNKDTVALAFDYMQNLPLPHIPVQEVFLYEAALSKCDFVTRFEN